MVVNIYSILNHFYIYKSFVKNFVRNHKGVLKN